MSYLRTGSGRLITAAAGIALAGGGVAALLGGTAAVALMCISLLLTVLVSLFAAGLGSTASAASVLLVLVTGPFAFFAYVLGLNLAIEHAPQVGYVLGILGALALARAAFITDEKSTGGGDELPIHAH